MPASVSQQIHSNPMQLRWLGGVLLLLVALLAGQGRVFSQRNQDSFIGISIVPESLGAVYPEGLEPGVLHWVYPGEPVVVQLVLSNNTPETLQIARRPREWFEAARLRVASKSQGKGTEKSAGVQEPSVSRRFLRRDLAGRGSLGPDTLRLEAGASEWVRFEVARDAELRAPGIYRFSVSLDEQSLPATAARRRNILQSERLIGVRELESRADAMNQAAHMATWARLDKDFSGARRWLTELLSLNPHSSVAYAQMGQVARDEGMCKEAVANWNKAIEILTSNSDPEGRQIGEDSIASLRGQIRRCQ